MNIIKIAFIFCLLNFYNIIGATVTTTKVELNVANSNSNYQTGQKCGIHFTCNSILDAIEYYYSFADIENQPLVIHLSSFTTFTVSLNTMVNSFSGNDITIVGSGSTIISGENSNTQFINLNNTGSTNGISTTLTLENLTFTKFNNSLINFGQHKSRLIINNCIFINNKYGYADSHFIDTHFINVFGGSELFISNSQFRSINGRNNYLGLIMSENNVEISSTSFDNIQDMNIMIRSYYPINFKISNCIFNNSNACVLDHHGVLDIESTSFNNFTLPLIFPFLSLSTKYYFASGSSLKSMESQLNMRNCQFNNINGIIEFNNYEGDNIIKHEISDSDFNLFDGFKMSGNVYVSIVDSLISRYSYRPTITSYNGGYLDIKNSAILNKGGDFIEGNPTVRLISNEFIGGNSFRFGCSYSRMTFINNNADNPSFSCNTCQNVTIHNEQFCSENLSLSLSLFNNIPILLILVACGMLSLIL